MKKFCITYSRNIYTNEIKIYDMEDNNEDDAKKKFIAMNLPNVYSDQIVVRLIEEKYTPDEAKMKE